MSGVLNYIKASFYEFRYNVDFPSWKDLSQSTLVVTVATIILALFLLGVDKVFENLMYIIYNAIDNMVSA